MITSGRGIPVALHDIVTSPLAISILFDGSMLLIFGLHAKSSPLTSSHILPIMWGGCWQVVGCVYNLRWIAQSRNFLRWQLQFHGLFWSSRLPSLGRFSKLCSCRVLKLFPSNARECKFGKLRNDCSSIRSNLLSDNVTFCKKVRLKNRPLSSILNLF